MSAPRLLLLAGPNGGRMQRPRIVVLGLEITENFFYLLFEDGDVRIYGIPNNSVINAYVVVDQPVAHAGNSAPIDLGMLVAKRFRQFFGSFADNFKASYECPLPFGVLEKSFPILAFTGSPKELRLDEDVPKEILKRQAGHIQLEPRSCRARGRLVTRG